MSWLSWLWPFSKCLDGSTDQVAEKDAEEVVFANPVPPSQASEVGAGAQAVCEIYQMKSEACHCPDTGLLYSGILPLGMKWLEDIVKLSCQCTSIFVCADACTHTPLHLCQ